MDCNPVALVDPWGASTNEGDPPSSEVTVVADKVKKSPESLPASLEPSTINTKSLEAMPRVSPTPPNKAFNNSFSIAIQDNTRWVNQSGGSAGKENWGGWVFYSYGSGGNGSYSLKGSGSGMRNATNIGDAFGALGHGNVLPKKIIGEIGATINDAVSHLTSLYSALDSEYKITGKLKELLGEDAVIVVNNDGIMEISSENEILVKIVLANEIIKVQKQLELKRNLKLVTKKVAEKGDVKISNSECSYRGYDYKKGDTTDISVKLKNGGYSSYQYYHGNIVNGMLGNDSTKLIKLNNLLK